MRSQPRTGSPTPVAPGSAAALHEKLTTAQLCGYFANVTQQSRARMAGADQECKDTAAKRRHQDLEAFARITGLKIGDLDHPTIAKVVSRASSW
jgi:hypothetical protein